MKKYYLMFSESENCIIIDTQKYPNAEIQKEIMANSWVEAKQKFGFQLTLKQEFMLEQ